MQKVPSEYNLFGLTYKVSIVEKDEWDGIKADGSGVWGQYDPTQNTIVVVRLSDDVTLQTFYHELVHSILTAMGHDLNEDEEFVDVFAGLLLQFIKTAK